MKSAEPSNRAMRSSHSSRAFSERETPIFSTTSSVSWIPAVSEIRSFTAPTVTDSVITSLVVPAISVTIALSYPASKLKNVDFPVFGAPAITVFTPRVIATPLA